MLTLGFILAFIWVYGTAYWWVVWGAGTLLCWLVVFPWLGREYMGWFQELMLGLLWPIVGAAILVFAAVSYAVDGYFGCRRYFARRRERKNRPDPFENAGGCGTMC